MCKRRTPPKAVAIQRDRSLSQGRDDHCGVAENESMQELDLNTRDEYQHTATTLVHRPPIEPGIGILSEGRTAWIKPGHTWVRIPTRHLRGKSPPGSAHSDNHSDNQAQGNDLDNNQGAPHGQSSLCTHSIMDTPDRPRGPDTTDTPVKQYDATRTNRWMKTGAEPLTTPAPLKNETGERRTLHFELDADDTPRLDERQDPSHEDSGNCSEGSEDGARDLHDNRVNLGVLRATASNTTVQQRIINDSNSTGGSNDGDGENDYDRESGESEQQSEVEDLDNPARTASDDPDGPTLNARCGSTYDMAEEVSSDRRFI